MPKGDASAAHVERSPLAFPQRQKAVPAPYGETVLSCSCSVTTQVTEVKSLVMFPVHGAAGLGGAGRRPDWGSCRLLGDLKGGFSEAF